MLFVRKVKRFKSDFFLAKIGRYKLAMLLWSELLVNIE